MTGVLPLPLPMPLVVEPFGSPFGIILLALLILVPEDIGEPLAMLTVLFAAYQFVSYGPSAPTLGTRFLVLIVVALEASQVTGEGLSRIMYRIEEHVANYARRRQDIQEERVREQRQAGNTSTPSNTTNYTTCGGTPLIRDPLCH